MTVKVLHAQLQTAFRQNAILKGPKSEIGGTYSNRDSVLVFSQKIGNKYSFATILEEIVLDDMIEEVILEVDKDIIGPLNDGQTVQIIKYTIPTADRIVLLIRDNLSVPEGNWGDLLKDQFQGQILDDSGKLLFTYPSSTPIMITGILKNANPFPPVRLSNKTKVIIKKADDVKITDHITRSNARRAERVTEFAKQINNNSIELIGLIKNDMANTVSTGFEFIANPKTVATGIKALFNSWKSLNDAEEIIDKDFIASYDFIDYKGEDPICMAEVFISSQEDLGKIFLHVHTVPTENANQILSELEYQIHGITVTTRTTARIIDDSCPNCGSQLDFQFMDERGWIKCGGCERFIEVPSKYRFH